MFALIRSRAATLACLLVLIAPATMAAQVTGGTRPGSSMRGVLVHSQPPI